MLRELERGGGNCFHMQFRVKGQEAGVKGEEEKVEDQEGAAVCWETYGSKCLARRSERPLLRKPLVRSIMV